MKCDLCFICQIEDMGYLVFNIGVVKTTLTSIQEVKQWINNPFPLSVNFMLFRPLKPVHCVFRQCFISCSIEYLLWNQTLQLVVLLCCFFILFYFGRSWYEYLPLYYFVTCFFHIKLMCRIYATYFRSLTVYLSSWMYTET